MTERFANAAQSVLTDAITEADLSVTVDDPSAFPDSGTFRCVIAVRSGSTLVDPEVVTVTAVAGSVFTIERASEPYAGVQTAFAHAAGAVIAQVVTAGGLANVIPDQLTLVAPESAPDGAYAIKVIPAGPGFTGAIIILTGDPAAITGNGYGIRMMDMLGGRQVFDVDAWGSMALNAPVDGGGGLTISAGDTAAVVEVFAGADLATSHMSIRTLLSIARITVNDLLTIARVSEPADGDVTDSTFGFWFDAGMAPWNDQFPYVPGATIVAEGHIWSTDGGFSGVASPDFAGNVGGTVGDNGMTWTDTLANAPAAPQWKGKRRDGSVVGGPLEVTPATDPGDVADPTLATPESNALAYNALLAAMRTAGSLA